MLAVFWGTGAGLLRTGTPYRGTSCIPRAAEHYPPVFQPFAGLCKKVVTIEAIAWTECSSFVLLLFKTIDSYAVRGFLDNIDGWIIGAEIEHLREANPGRIVFRRSCQ
jgi:hypothetical protein